jgi:hypothetical protein
VIPNKNLADRALLIELDLKIQGKSENQVDGESTID